MVPNVYIDLTSGRLEPQTVVIYRGQTINVVLGYEDQYDTHWYAFGKKMSSKTVVPDLNIQIVP